MATAPGVSVTSILLATRSLPRKDVVACIKRPKDSRITTRTVFGVDTEVPGIQTTVELAPRTGSRPLEAKDPEKKGSVPFRLPLAL